MNIMEKVLKVREVGDSILEKISEEVNINNINKDYQKEDFIRK